ncbi:MAG: homocysteine S-methyltransferase [Pseudolysinimonas sp.]
MAAALATGPVILDGGLGTLLDARGNDVSSDLWSARILLEDPDEVRSAHAEFFAAGAQVATTASYQVSYEGLWAMGRDAAETDEVLARSVRLAAEARDDSPGGGWVAASIGPYGATLADGSEYRGDDGLTVAELRAWHRRRLQVLAEAGPDVLAIETITRLAELEALAAELEGIGIPAWMSVTISGGTLRTGESLREAFAIAAAAEGVVAVGVNCCDAADVSGALALARESGRATLAYPNSGEMWDGASRTWTGTSHLPGDLVDEWAADGTALIGGCCRIGPDGIAAIAQRVAAARPGGAR